MRVKALLASTSLVGALALMPLVPAQAQTAAALTGQVSSAEEGMMEGVLVSAKREGSTITTTVVTNDKGQYSFPAGRLEPGHYDITIRATGYVLDGPKAVDVAAGGAKADLKLAKTKNLVGQLTNAEWLISAPGEDRIKSFLPDCVGCHSLQRVFTSTHDAEEFKTVFTRMGRYAPESVPSHPQLIVQGGARSERPRVPANMMQAAADYLSSVNLSTADHETFGLKTLPRPKGRATHVIVTEYDLARKEALPHDVIVDADGHAWYSDFGNQYVGELDPKTGKVTDYALPLLRPEQPKGSLDMEFDPSGDNIWIGMSYQAGTSVINRKTKEIKTYPLPKEWAGLTTQTNMASVTHSDVDGKLWMDDTENHHVYRLNISTGEWENKGEATSADGKTISGYGIPTDKFNNLYMLEFGNTRIGMLDAKTNVAQIWNTPIVRSRPRRGRFDDQGHLWFAQYGGNAIGMFDPTTQQIKEYQLPTPWTNPYDVVPTKGATEVWTGSMLTDRVVRLNTKTDDVIEYLLPHSTNIRRVFVQETGPHPVLWVGNNHGAAIVKVEPLD
jgi:virginiamycin B lyase